MKGPDTTSAADIVRVAGNMKTNNRIPVLNELVFYRQGTQGRGSQANGLWSLRPLQGIPAPSCEQGGAFALSKNLAGCDVDNG